MVRILFLDTASGQHSLALCDEEHTLILKTLPKQGESRVIPILKEALKEAKWSDDTLTHIACVIGPGGFVSLRIGVTAANTLAWSLKLPLAGVHLSALWAARVPSPSPLPRGEGWGEGFFWLHSTRRTQLFVRGFGTFAQQFPEPTLVDLETASKLTGDYVGELLEEHQKALPGCTPLMNVQSLETILPAFLKNLEYKKQQLLPWYGREA